ncbi:MAG TPA: 30S ribosomal protein S16 [Anaerolineae bacterium]
MAAKIRLTRFGSKKQPTYRVVVKEEHSKRDGRYLENLGYYDPRTEPSTIVLNHERVNYWLSVGAQPTDAVGVLLRSAGITDKFLRTHAAKKKRGEEAKTETTETPPAG